MRVSFIVPGPAQPWQRAGQRVVGKFVRNFTQKETRIYEALVKSHAVAAMAGRPPMDGALKMSLQFRREPPTSVSKVKRQAMLDGLMAPFTKPDLDNLTKAIKDACNQTVYVDDARIVEMHIYKVYAAVPGVAVVVEDWG